MLVQHPLDAPIESIARTRIVDVPGTATVAEAARTLTEHAIGLLLVRRGGTVCGVLSERDVVRGVSEGVDPRLDRVTEHMSEDLAGVREGATLREAAAIMIENDIRHLLVRRQGRVVGIVSARDVLAAVHQAV